MMFTKCDFIKQAAGFIKQTTGTYTFTIYVFDNIVDSELVDNGHHSSASCSGS